MPTLHVRIAALDNPPRPRTIGAIVAAVLLVGCGWRANDTCAVYVETLSSDDETQRYEAAQWLGLRGPAAAHTAPNLLAVIEDQSPAVRAEAATAIGRILVVRARVKNPPEPSVSPGEFQRLREQAIAALIERLDDTDGSVRVAAVMAIAKIGAGSADALKALEAATGSKDRDTAAIATFEFNWLKRSAERHAAESEPPAKAGVSAEPE